MLNTEQGTAPSYTRRALELRAAEYYASIRKPESEWKTLEDLAPQLAEFEYRIHCQDYEGAGILLKSIDYDYLFMWGYYALLIDLHERLIGRLKEPQLVMEDYGRLANAYMALDWLNHAIQLYEQAIAVARKFGNKWYEAAWLGRLGNMYRDVGMFKLAYQTTKLACEIDDEIGEVVGKGWNLANLASIHRDLGEYNQAIALYGQSLEIAQQKQERWMEGSCLRNIGRIHFALGDFKRSIVPTEKALCIAQEIEYLWGHSHSLLGLTAAYLAIGQLEEAQHYCGQAEALAVWGDSYMLAFLHGTIALHHNTTEAQRYFALCISKSQDALSRTARLHDAQYTLAAGEVGKAVADQEWCLTSQRAQLLTPALAEYRRALAIIAAPGVVRDALRDLELIRAAGIAGLEPVFALLEETLPR
ncbi:MAG TPA: tetratricopeptide repeat protein [Anaerolineae bacterium]|nr:tetratricopeptide repeat protein [Anaerolineae bacterium]